MKTDWNRPCKTRQGVPSGDMEDAFANARMRRYGRMKGHRREPTGWIALWKNGNADGVPDAAPWTGLASGD